MTAASDRLPRLLALVPWLRRHPGTRMADLAARFGVSEQQIKADLNLLWICGLPGLGPGDLIDLVFEDDRVSVVDPQTLDRPLRLTADEALALTVAARALADVPGLLEREAIDRAVAKLTSALAGAHAEPVAVALEPAGETLRLLEEAVTRQRRVHLRYLVETRDEVTERDVDPLRVVNQEGRFYLEGWCHRAEAVRLFRLDRIAVAQLLDAPSSPPPEAVPRDLADGLFAPADTDERVVLELSPAARWVADYYACEAAEQTPDGGLLVTLPTPDTGWVRRLVLGLGVRARVLAPATLAAEVRAAAAAALAAYGETPDAR